MFTQQYELNLSHLILKIKNYGLVEIKYKKKGNVLERNNEARSRNQCCSGKAISVTYSECVSVASAI